MNRSLCRPELSRNARRAARRAPSSSSSNARRSVVIAARFAHLVEDRFGGCERIGGFGDRPPHDEIIRAGGDGLRRRHRRAFDRRARCRPDECPASA